MKKYSIYIGILIGGLVLGYFIFGGDSSDKTMKGGETTEMSDGHDHGNENGETQMWTCSMHPQIMLPEPGDCPICGMDLIPAEQGAGGLTTDQFIMTENALALANIQTTLVGGSRIEDNTLVLSGKVMENEELNAVQVSYFAGRIEKLYVNFTGEQVNRGQLLATIYSPELVSAQQELLTAASLKESQPGLYKAVRNKLKLWKLSEKQINSIESSGQVKENFPVYATVSGTVTEKMAQEGDYVKQGQPIYKIANLSSVWTMFDAYENQIAELEEGQEISITTNAYSGKEFTAKISFIDPVLNTASRTVMIRASLPNKEGLFKPGMFVQGKVRGITKDGNEAIVVPQSAVLWTGERSVVYVKAQDDEPVFEHREVKLGKSRGDQYEILEGLQNGDQIVTQGTFTVDAAAQLKGKKSMMSPEGGSTNSMPGMPGMNMGGETKGQMDGKEMIQKGQVGTEKFLEGKAYDFRNETPKAFRQQLNAVIHAYLSLKDGLVQADEKSTSRYSSELVGALQNVDDNVLKGDAKAFWEEKKSFLMQHAKLCKEASTIAGKRENFIYLSQPLIKVVEAYGPGDEKLYVDFCPMANDNKGAFWLSANQEIQNPFMPADMRSCGEVKQEIASNK
ncbi:membrane fusion protein, Cu(I)/Ag(I) efflux system [Flagellimonas taeanensis]|uniref:Membrane fusion protein, Cu(I)/Ag(I) efflux system n=1 Tax=Flagellimonas taeanensis TaxID=1005926 RepID=A0A1M7B7K9_9FLAO|nr:efflux RND transporter periplasmic adaptor subunit [Allomuricauda taeanensis]SFC38315.1 membrane fusion protein, Cu(I)/Ag(I) efflux system [Allomuricauda taeanensis]SHL50914.1 membrane fusion protein, Cu(I)/Ag(I) efflux system [Allomuricauda taeanensis]